MSLHIGDLDLGARWLAQFARADWPKQLNTLSALRTKATAHRKATGQALAGAGEGSLCSAVLAQGFPPPLLAQNRLYLLALAALAFHLAFKDIILPSSEPQRTLRAWPKHKFDSSKEI